MQNIQNPLRNFVAAALISLIPSFITIRLNLREKKQSQPISSTVEPEYTQIQAQLPLHMILTIIKIITMK